MTQNFKYRYSFIVGNNGDVVITVTGGNSTSVFHVGKTFINDTISFEELENLYKSVKATYETSYARVSALKTEKERQKNLQAAKLKMQIKKLQDELSDLEK